MGLANIPTDWLGEYKDFVVRWPNSDAWLAVLRGQLTAPAFTDFWDQFSGDPSPSVGAMDDTFSTNLHLMEGAMLPSGICMMWAGDTVPTGWLLRDGSEVSRVTYANLFAAIGTIWGAGDGTTTFNLPYAQGRIDLGYDVSDADFNQVGDFGGQKNVTLEEDEIPSHNHTQNSHNHTQNSHNHTQDSHNHAQNSHNHIQNPHTHTQAWFIVAAGTKWVSTGGTTFISAGGVAGIVSTETPTNQAATAVNQATTPTNQATTPTNQATTPTNQAAGGGQSHNNLQPYGVYLPIIKA